MGSSYLNGHERDDQRGHVAQHVKTVRHQRHGIGHVADDDLDEEEAERQPHHDDQTRFRVLEDAHRE